MQISSSGGINTAATAAAAAVAPAISEIGERISATINVLDVPGIDLVDSDGVLPYVNAAIDAASTQVAGVQMLQEQVDASLDEVIHMQHTLWACGALAWNSIHSTFNGDTILPRSCCRLRFRRPLSFNLRFLKSCSAGRSKLSGL